LTARRLLMLTEQQKATLLELARSAIDASVLGQPLQLPAAPGEFPAASGVFVTIKRHGQLRGCLGTLENRRGLTQEIVRCAADSAKRDPRFAPVGTDELKDLRVELSILGPLEEIEARPDAFTIGVHGLVVELGGRRGLLLPQVATEWGWTPEQFLVQTCVKAGLPDDAWRRGAIVYRFAAEVFGS
jgi:AmmeMemoRadiSam system protein A